MPDPAADPDTDTDDLRAGAPLHDALLALLPLVGTWRGGGTGSVASTGESFAYRQQVSFVHDGRPFLAYASRSWLVDADGAVIRAAWRESGFWRPGPGQDDVEVVLASNTGQALMFTGLAGDTQWEIATESAVHVPTGMSVDGERRLYAMLGGSTDELVYATELAPGGAPYAPHLNGALVRVAAVPGPGPG